MQFLEYFVKVSQCCYDGQYIRCPKAIVGLLTQIASCVVRPLFMKFRFAFFYSLLGENIFVLVFTHVMRQPCWCTKQWQDVAQVLHNNRIKLPKDFFRYCSVHQHGRRDVT